MVNVEIEPLVAFRTEVLHYEVLHFSPLVCDAQCCEVKIHFPITSGEQPCIANEKQLGFFQKGCCICWWAMFGWNKRRLR